MEIRTEIEISAAPAEVWATLVEFSRYPEWNPFIVSLLGEAKPGASLAVTLSLPDSNKEQTFRPRVIKCDEGSELRWLGHLWMKGLLDGEHFFRLEASGPGSTRFVHGEDFTGIFVRLLLSRMSDIARGFVYMNLALKRRVEAKKSGAATSDQMGAAPGDRGRP
jgi:hypothetical protein